jgi:phosphoglycerate dehydrogenase-like enzyme
MSLRLQSVDLPVPALSPGRVLYTLSEKERGLFFPDFQPAPGFEVFQYARGTDFLGALKETMAEAVITSWSTPAFQPEWLAELPHLRYVAHTTGSVRHLIPRVFLENGLLVTNWGKLAGGAVAEHALLLVLAGLRRLPDWAPVIAGESDWHPAPVRTQTLYGRRVGIHGFGNVARALVALLRPFGVEVRAFSEGVPREEFANLGVHYCASLEDLFSGCEILVECEALSPQNQYSVTRKILQLLAPGALFVNVGRGRITDEEALADLALAGHLRLALDVFANDPIAPDSPLHRVPDAILSPHIAGPTVDQLPECGALVRRNLSAFFAGQPLEARVTLEIYDRAT